MSHPVTSGEGNIQQRGVFENGERGGSRDEDREDRDIIGGV